MLQFERSSYRTAIANAASTVGIATPNHPEPRWRQPPQCNLTRKPIST
jgi:hypothetical protein